MANQKEYVSRERIQEIADKHRIKLIDNSVVVKSLKGSVVLEIDAMGVADITDAQVSELAGKRTR